MQDSFEAQHTDGLAADHDEVAAVNRANWDDRVPIHALHYESLRAMPPTPP